MSNQIKTIIANAETSWTTDLPLENVSGDLVFHVVGGTFSDGSAQKTISPNVGVYSLALKGTPPTDQSTVQQVAVYYEMEGEWVLSQDASRILARQQTKEIDYRIQRSGFGALPKNAALTSPYYGAIISGGVAQPTDANLKAAIEAGDYRALAQMPSAPFNTTRSPYLIHDKPNGALYVLNAADTVADLRVGYKFTDDEDGTLATAIERIDPAGTERQFVLFYTNGQIRVYDKSFALINIVQATASDVTRAVYRRKGIGSNTVDSVVLLTSLGVAHYLDASFAEQNTRQDKFYTDASDSYDVLCTRSGQLVGQTVSNAPTDFAFYQFVPSSLIAIGVRATTGDICQFNIRDNAEYAPSRNLVKNDRVVYNTTSDWSVAGIVPAGGFDTTGGDGVFDFANAASSVTTNRDGWSYLGIFGTPYEVSDSTTRRFFSVARPTNNLTHLNVRDYSATLPQFDQAGSDSVTFTLVVESGDADIPLEIKLPNGVVWTAKINGESVRYVRDGDQVEFTVSHPNITQHSFPISIGRSTTLFEQQPDTMPDAFDFVDVSGIEDGEVYQTEEITITGINTRVPVSVTVNGQPAEDNVQIFINGEQAIEPFMISNGGKLRLEVLHEGDTSRVVVSVGSGVCDFGIFTVPEPRLNTIRNWAYQPRDVEVVSDAITNPGPQRLTLTITNTTAKFNNDQQTVTLAAGQSATISFTPPANEQYVIPFDTEQNHYEWQVWADDHWLDPQPETDRAERYVFADSGDISFDAIPENFYTHIRVPAGILLQVNGEYVDLPLDVRGVYKEQTEIRNLECSTTVLKMEGLPSHDQPHTIMLGDAALEWLYDFTEDPTYSGQADSVILPVAQHYETVDSTEIQTVDQQHVVEVDCMTAEFDQAFESQDSRVVVASFASRFEPHMDSVVGSSYDRMFVESTAWIDTVFIREFETRADFNQAEFDSRFIPIEAGVISTAFDRGFSDKQSHLILDAEIDQQYQEGGSGFDSAMFQMRGPNTVSIAEYLHVDAASANLLRSGKALHQNAAQVNLSRAGDANNIDSLAPRTVPMLRPERVDQANAELVKGVVPYVLDNDRLSLVRPSGLIQQSSLQHNVATATVYHTDTATPDVFKAMPQYAIDTGRAVWRQYKVPNKYTNMTPRWTHIPRVTFTYAMTVAYSNKRKPYQLSTVGKVAQATRWFSLDLEARYVESSGQLSQIDGSAARTVQAPKSYQQKLTADRAFSNTVSSQNTNEPRKIDAPKVNPIAMSVGYTVGALVKSVEPAASNRVKTTVLAVTRQQPRRPVVKAIHVPRAEIVTFVTEVSQGETDPLKQGYFETEQLALQNAVQVWGHDPSAVYAIKQPNGYWTWAQVIPCENTCGVYGCDTRGYLSGG
ncbi:hypothetical protein YOLOSWAG_148 [Erwinia phage vB_EamM_Yoloswag]|uniref:Uncharacterized protein n=1 Tax=Erwinia phage vB_EamM_Yoloswag TaxID=1958956 RepID=A0A1S6L371_9CAUD|nr:hypothetical protein HOR66_gp148 [Erwinia phage vB_EamM_Yoloswag]AQT28628.1 hypothetical protein YOLOSWAG_148 [Erwinia phage vB_EamM_Yoloswag]